MATIITKKIFDGVTLNSSSETSDIIKLGADIDELSGGYNMDGYFTIQFEFDEIPAGAPEITLGYLASLDGTNFYTPEDADLILTAHTKTDGNAGNGTLVKSVPCVLAPYLKLAIVEGAGADATVSLWLSWQ